MRPGPLVALAHLNIAQSGAQQVNVTPSTAAALLPQDAPAVPFNYPFLAPDLESPLTTR